MLRRRGYRFFAQNRASSKTESKMRSDPVRTRFGLDEAGSRRRRLLRLRRDRLHGSFPKIDTALGGIAVDLGELVLAEAEIVEGSQRIVELLDVAGADQGRGDPRVAQDPG